MSQATFMSQHVWIVAISVYLIPAVECMSSSEKLSLKEQVLEMFNHGYRSYMKHAYPADELMPLSCKGRYRDIEPSRGTVDDVLGNFSLTLIDTLDTLVVLGDVGEFDRAVRLVISDVSFDQDVVVSLFETNIRILGGLLGGHIGARQIQANGQGMRWYNDELLDMALDVGYRLLPAFNTSTGIPYPRVNLKYGVTGEKARTGHERDTCTACAGTIILEFAALSRLTGIHIFEWKAVRALHYLWSQRHRISNLMGNVINIHTGDWVHRESGVGAGIDSYYEYLLKAYILLGDDSYLDRFNQHYEAIMKYVSQGPFMLDVHMHKPLSPAKNFMDALLAFWPGLQVLKGDIRPAIQFHEMLYQVIRRHKFLPEAFTSDFRVHWGQHPLRPEFVESTYFLYKATGDSYYLEVGKSVLENLQKHARVHCGFAAIRDVTTGVHEDQMDSFVLAETFKYLYLLFAEKQDLLVDIDQYLFTTEAHLLPLNLSMAAGVKHNHEAPIPYVETDSEIFRQTCPNTDYLFPGNAQYAQSVRDSLKTLVGSSCAQSPSVPRARSERLKPSHFVATNRAQLEELRCMGIRLTTMEDGRIQLLHSSADADTEEDAQAGINFMQEMIALSKMQHQDVQSDPRIVQLLSPPHLGKIILNAGPAQFGPDLKKVAAIHGQLQLAEPFQACSEIVNAENLKGRIALMKRGSCMFIEKARYIEKAGAIAGLVMDSVPATEAKTQPLFAMSGDGTDDVHIPLVFLFDQESQQILQALSADSHLSVHIGSTALSVDEDLRREACRQLEGETVKTTETAEEGYALRKICKYLLSLKLRDLTINFQRDDGSGQPASEPVWQTADTDSEQASNLLRHIVSLGPSSLSILYIELISLLQTTTNFSQLVDSEKYLVALREFLDVCSHGYKKMKFYTEGLLDRLVGQLSNDRSKAFQPDLSSMVKDQIDNLMGPHVDGDAGSSTVAADQAVNVPVIDVGSLPVRAKSKQENMQSSMEKKTMSDDSNHAVRERAKKLQEKLGKIQMSLHLLEKDATGEQQGANQDELTVNVPPPPWPLVQVAPDWLNLKPGELYVDAKGVTYFRADDIGPGVTMQSMPKEVTLSERTGNKRVAVKVNLKTGDFVTKVTIVNQENNEEVHHSESKVSCSEESHSTENANSCGKESSSDEKPQSENLPSPDEIQKPQSENLPSSDEIQKPESENLPSHDEIQKPQSENLPSSDEIQKPQNENVPLSYELLRSDESENYPSSEESPDIVNREVVSSVTESEESLEKISFSRKVHDSSVFLPEVPVIRSNVLATESANEESHRKHSSQFNKRNEL